MSAILDMSEVGKGKFVPMAFSLLLSKWRGRAHSDIKLPLIGLFFLNEI